MSIRINPSDRLEVLRPDIVIVHDDQQASDEPMLIERARDDDTSPATGRRGVLPWLAVAAVLAVVAAAFAAGVVVGGDNAGTSATTNKPRVGSAPAAAGELQVSVEAPARIVAGKPATFTVEYAGPPALFSGTVEDWGDGVGVGSTSQGACAGAPKAQTPLAGRYTVSHTWAEPGTYTVVLGVNAFSCVGDQPRPTEASSTLTVNVVAP